MSKEVFTFKLDISYKEKEGKKKKKQLWMQILKIIPTTLDYFRFSLFFKMPKTGYQNCNLEK